MDGAQLKQLWRSGQPSFGAWVALTDPAATVVMCNVGYDWLMIDAEHRPFNAETMRTLIVTMRSEGVVPLVRVRGNDEAIIKQVLDMGAEGVGVPMIRTVQDARRAVMASRLPPVGARGCGPSDAARFYKDPEHYLSNLDHNILVLLWIEHADAVAHLEDILEVPGVDALVIGPVDLSHSLGLPWQISHRKVQEAIDVTIAKARAARIPVGISVTDEDFESWQARGVNILFLGSDFEFIMQAGSSILNRVREGTDPGTTAYRTRAW